MSVITTSVEHINPARAKMYLDRNVCNYRAVSKFRVDTYAVDMKNGKWELNGEAIKFNRNGELTDGQHRLLAIIKANTTVPMLVTRGIDPEVSVYDVGQGRSMAQIVKQLGGGSASRNGVIGGAAGMLFSGKIRPGGHTAPKKTVADFLIAHEVDFEKVYDLIRVNQTNGKMVGRKAAIALALYCLIRSGESYDELLEFMRVVNSGFPVERESSSAIVLRNLIAVMYDGGRGAVNPEYTHEDLFVNAVNAFYDFRDGFPRKKNYNGQKYKNKAMDLFNLVRSVDIEE